MSGEWDNATEEDIRLVARLERERINRMTQTSGFVTVTDGANMTQLLARVLETCL